MARQFSLRNFLVVPFLTLFLGAAGLIGWVGYRSGQESLEQFERQMAAEIGMRISAHLDRFFSSAVVVAQSTAEAMRSGRLDPSHLDDLERQFVGQMRYLPYLTFVSFGRADGQYVGATRSLDTNEVRLMTSLKREGMTLDAYAVDDNNARAARIAGGPAFDARTRIWYRQAEERGRLSWYPVYKYKPYESLGVGVSVPVYEPGSRRLLGVATGDVALAQIARYLQTQTIGRSGIAFVAELDGKLIATSLASPTFRLEGENVVRLSIAEYPDPRMREAGQWVQRAAAGQQFVTVNGERHLLDLRPYRDAFGLNLQVGVLLPEADFSAPFNDNLQLASWLTLAIAALGSLFGVLMTGWLVRPILAINRRAGRIARGELVGGDGAETVGPIRELNALNQSFNAMAASLRSTFFGLEARVAERTRELEAVNDELERMAMLDGLTHIANRRRFDIALQQEWRRCLREHQPISLLMLDVDDFKAYNDEYGHQAGDRVLINVASLCERATQRPTDLAARYGGEEFAIILPNTNAVGALSVAEEVAAALRSAAIPHCRATAAAVVTVSVGVATHYPELRKAPEKLVGAADAALYAAKRAGRNRVMVSDEMD